jgi:Uncharacterised nucleotidyltransferase
VPEYSGSVCAAKLGPVPDQEILSGTSSPLPFPRQDPNHAPRKSLGRPCATDAGKHYATFRYLTFVDIEPEDQLCVTLARGEISGEVRERTFQLLASPLRWPLFLEHARKYDICPIIYQNLETLGFRSVPDPIRTELATIFGVNAIRCEVLRRETARILQLLGEAGIPVMPLKGIALAASLYHDPALGFVPTSTSWCRHNTPLTLFTSSWPQGTSQSSRRVPYWISLSVTARIAC